MEQHWSNCQKKSKKKREIKGKSRMRKRLVRMHTLTDEAESGGMTRIAVTGNITMYDLLHFGRRLCSALASSSFLIWR